jgi:hypothetical protein
MLCLVKVSAITSSFCTVVLYVQAYALSTLKVKGM